MEVMLVKRREGRTRRRAAFHSAFEPLASGQGRWNSETLLANGGTRALVLGMHDNIRPTLVSEMMFKSMGKQCD